MIRRLASRFSNSLPWLFAHPFRLVLVASISLIFGGQLLSWRVPVDVRIDMAVSTTATGQLFIDRGNGYTEQDSLPIRLKPDGALHSYDARFWVAPLRTRIRVDPGTTNGSVKVCRIDVSSGLSRVSVDLPKEILPINQLSASKNEGRCMRMEAIGDDPHFQFKVRARTFVWTWLTILTGAALVGAGIALLVFAAVKARQEEVVPEISSGAWAVMAFIVVVAALTLVGLGCNDFACSTRGVDYGLRIFAAGLGCAAVGGAFLSFIRMPGLPKFFLSLIVGQAVLVLYVYLRSFQNHHFVDIPLRGYEFFALALTSMAYLITRKRELWIAGGDKAKALVVQIAMLAAISLIVADRELPRLLMLSTDPDVHAFFAKQLERFGSIPTNQGAWGAEGFNYPAGSPSLIFAWSSLGWLGVGNAVTSLSLFQILLAALVVIDWVTASHAQLHKRVFIASMALAMFAVGFMMPLYLPFSHMEGTGRQMGIAFIAAIITTLLGIVSDKSESSSRYIVLLLLAFVVATLNPINVFLPVLSIAFVGLLKAWDSRKVPWRVLIPASFVFPLCLDPYFSNMVLGGSAPVMKLGLSPALIDKPFASVIDDWKGFYSNDQSWVGDLFFRMLPWDSVPAFIMAVGALVLIAAVLRVSIRNRWPTWVAGLLFAASIVVLAGLFAALQNDRKYYLLYPYFLVALAQYKILIVAILAACLLSVVVKKWAVDWRSLTVSLMIVLMVGLSARIAQPIQAEPRLRSCEQGKCLATDDLRLLQKFEQAMGAHEFAHAMERGSRVLAPNVVATMGLEQWAFPAGAARLLGTADVLPVAFYYMQADSDFTAANYQEHICGRLDRAWLKEERIDYVFVPAQLDYACVEGLTSLRKTEDVVIREGDSYLLRLKR